MTNRNKKTRNTGNQWKQLVGGSDRDIAGTDIAVQNLVCALGLPGAEGLNVTRCCQKLSKMARQVKREIRRNDHRFRRDGPAAGFNREQWEVGMMITVLQQDFGVTYNMAKAFDPDFTDSRDLFIHGMLFGEGGTCASMPVLYVAVGRRIGFPLMLVSAKAHLLCRWQDQRQRFNVEGSGRGFSSFDDEYYHRWPKPLSPAEIAQKRFLTSMSPREELAAFLVTRGHCLQDNERFAEAEEAYQAGYDLAPQTPYHREFLWLARALMGKPVPLAIARQAEKERIRIRTEKQQRERERPCTVQP